MSLDTASGQGPHPQRRDTESGEMLDTPRATRAGDRSPGNARGWYRAACRRCGSRNEGRRRTPAWPIVDAQGLGPLVVRATRAGAEPGNAYVCAPHVRP